MSQSILWHNNADVLNRTKHSPKYQCVAFPEEVIYDILIRHPQDQSNSVGYKDQSDVHFSEQSDSEADTSSSAVVNSGGLDSPESDNSEDHPEAAT